MTFQDATDEDDRGVADHPKSTNTPEKAKSLHKAARAQILAGGYTKGLCRFEPNISSSIE